MGATSSKRPHSLYLNTPLTPPSYITPLHHFPSSMSPLKAAVDFSPYLLHTAVLSPFIALVAIFFFLYFKLVVLHGPSRAPAAPSRAPGILLSLSCKATHRVLATLATSFQAIYLMSFSVGFTRFIVSTHPSTAKDILNSSAFADRPIKESAYELLFHRAIGFAPFGEYWRNLRRISATHLFSPKRLSASADQRSSIGLEMIADISAIMAKDGHISVKRLLHCGSLNNLMMSVFGRKFNFGEVEGVELEEMVREGYELLGVFNWGDHFPLLGWLDLQGVRTSCRALASRVNVFVGKIIEQHKLSRSGNGVRDFVDVLLDLEDGDKLSDSDMVAVLWEMIFRGTDTVAILLEWIMARMVLHQEIQSKAQAEIDAVVGGLCVSDGDIANLPYLQSIVKETLRMHPPGPLLSWARLAVHDTEVGEHFIPAGTTTMVNMWAIAHDESIWPEAEKFRPERFMEEAVNIMGSDMRLAPFGSGRRVCPEKALGLGTVQLWLAQLLQRFKWVAADGGIDLSECLKMSLEMEKPLVCKAIPRC